MGVGLKMGSDDRCAAPTFLRTMTNHCQPFERSKRVRVCSMRAPSS